MENRRSVVRSFVWAMGFLLFSFFLALQLGAVSNADIEVITEIRLPRILLAAAIGMGLSVAGAALQALFANPLCEPYTLGISSGAALGAVVGAAFGLNWNIAGIAGPAFLGAILFAGILFFISLRSRAGNATLLLAGVMLGFLGTSLVSLWLAITDTNGIQSTLAWLFGDLTRARLKGSIFTLTSIISLIVIIWGQSRDLDGLLLGEEGASALGVDVDRVRRKVIILTSLLIGFCVSAGGMIGFVGLVIPHFSRRWVGSLHLFLIPLCAIWGAVALTTADWVSRTLFRPYELPVGVVTALIGAPLFMGILLKRELK